MSTRAVALALIALALPGCAWVENAILGEPARIVPPAEALPDLFAPLRWDTPEAELPRIFPGATLHDGPWFGEPFWLWYRSQGIARDIPPLGRVEVEIQYVRPGHGDAPPSVSAVTARRRDPRAECARGGGPARCRAAPPALREAFERASAGLVARYGRGEPGDAVDAGGAEVTWPRDGFRLILRLGTEPGDDLESEADDVWELSLAAESERAF